jgi:O-methyltransferase involved in polyketide biosynthesis
MLDRLETQLTGVPRTMLMTTRARMEEHQRPDAIFCDPQVMKWWQFLQWDAELDRFYNPLAQLTWAARANLFDQIARRFVDSHEGAIAIELGAGLSTRYHRIGQSYRYWLELDVPEITSLRCQLDTQTETHRFLARSALDFSWMDEIPAGEPKNLLIIAEGLLMYFEATQVQELIARLKQRFPGATLVFDAVGSSPKSKGAKQLAQLGAPLKWFIKDEQTIAEMGLFVVNVQSLIQENCRYRDLIGIYRWLPWIRHLQKSEKWAG